MYRNCSECKKKNSVQNKLLLRTWEEHVVYRNCFGHGGSFVTKTREENLGLDQYHMLVEPPDHQI